MKESNDMRLNEYLIAGTDADVAELYGKLPQYAEEMRFGLVENEVVILDTETTGLDPTRSALIEIAAVRMAENDIVARFETFVNPGCSIPPEITELTGITTTDVQGAPSPREAVAQLAEFAESCDLVAHNASFDRDFIMRQAEPGAFGGAWVDTLALSQIALPRLKSHRLIDLVRAFGIPVMPSHRAMDDTLALARLWRILLAATQCMTPGLAAYIAGLSPQTPWSLRPYFSQAAQASPGADFSLKRIRSARTQPLVLPPREDADEVPLSFCDEAQVKAAFSPGGLVDAMYPSYEQREEQLEMAAEVAASLQAGDFRVIEAGTGVGKSMAYLVPLALGARDNKITMGVATKTNALMDQLVYHELPRLKRVFEHELTYVALKGYDHYLCLRKLESMARNSEEDGVDVIQMIATLLNFTAQTSHGDLDALNLHWYGLPRAEIQANPHDCLKKRCPFFPRRCFLHGARRFASSADVVVTNHALLFRDMQADNGILPPIRHWVIDEAHSVESEARRQLSHAVTARDLEATLGRISNPRGGLCVQIRSQATKLEGAGPLHGITVDIDGRAERIRMLASGFFLQIKELDVSDDSGSGSYDLVTLWVNEQLRKSDEWQLLCTQGFALSDDLKGLTGRLSDLVSMLEQYEGSFASQIADLSSIASDLRSAAETLRLVLEGSDKSFVYSVHFDRNPNRTAEALEAMRLDIGETLVQEFYPQERSLIFTSATLATAEKDPFAHFLRATGLDRVVNKSVHTCILTSGYDYDRNMTVLLPSDMPEPNSPQYRREFARLLRELHVAMGGSVLTLFTNRREMEAFYRELKPLLAEDGIELVAQSRGSNAKALRDRFLADKDLSLFALKSFWEGFDAPGDTLRCVIIARLPFSRPNDPIMREREVRAGRTAWRRYALPEAVMDLKQAAGRLIRNSTDSGWLVLADARLQTKNYASSFLRAMPTSDIRTLTIDEIAQVMRSEEPGR